MNPSYLRYVHNLTLNRWREILPEALAWNDSDPPSTHINHARLRAKYYGALYIIHRPFLRLALESDLSPESSPTSRETSQIATNRPSSSSTPYAEHPPGSMAPPSSVNGTLPTRSEILRSARICVEAAIASTVAFDGIAFKRRLIVTNIFGTAHA